MEQKLKLMCILAHPDDESLGTGGILAKYAAEGVQTSLLTATRGERGWPGEPFAYPGQAALGHLRENELRAAADILGVHELVLLDYIDGDLDQTDPAIIQAQIAHQLRRLRPDVVVTFDPSGAYGHPDQIAICQFTLGGILLAHDPAFEDPAGLAPHLPSKLYYLLDTEEDIADYTTIFGDFYIEVDGVKRSGRGFPAWLVNAWIDTRSYRAQVFSAIGCHRSQFPQMEEFLAALEKTNLYKYQTFARAYSLVNGGRQPEDDLFTGLREGRA